MRGRDHKTIIEEFSHFIMNESYPCVAARAAVSRQQIACLVVDHMACGHQDEKILSFLYDFIAGFRSANRDFHSAAVIFEGPQDLTSEAFDTLLWKRLQALSDLDAQHCAYDQRVDSDPAAPNFSFSLGEEAFFVIGLQPAGPRLARRFRYPVIVFNPHIQFERMRQADRYEKLKAVVRRRDMAYSGSINPMLADFGERSEVYQYSGNVYSADWTCPLQISHGQAQRNSSEK